MESSQPGNGYPHNSAVKERQDSPCAIERGRHRYSAVAGFLCTITLGVSESKECTEALERPELREPCLFASPGKNGHPRCVLAYIETHGSQSAGDGWCRFGVGPENHGASEY